eukprot:6618299-Alexandrium_andersonii.AAC.1
MGACAVALQGLFGSGPKLGPLAVLHCLIARRGLSWPTSRAVARCAQRAAQHCSVAARSSIRYLRTPGVLPAGCLAPRARA